MEMQAQPIGSLQATGPAGFREIVVDPDPDPGPGSSGPQVVEVPDYRAELPLAASIMPVAMKYGYAMLDTLHERSGEPRIAPLPPAYEEKVVRGGNGRQSVARALVKAEPHKWFSGAYDRFTLADGEIVARSCWRPVGEDVESGGGGNPASRYHVGANQYLA